MARGFALCFVVGVGVTAAMSVVAAAEASASDDDSDDDGLQLVRRAHASRFQQRSALLCRHMRKVKQAYGKKKSEKSSMLTPHVLNQVRHHNSVFAVRPADVIVPRGDGKPVRTPGKGRYKCWLPSAILRVTRRPGPESVVVIVVPGGDGRPLYRHYSTTTTTTTTPPLLLLLPPPPPLR